MGGTALLSRRPIWSRGDGEKAAIALVNRADRPGQELGALVEEQKPTRTACKEEVR